MCLQFWESIGASKQLLDGIRNGVRLPFFEEVRQKHQFRARKISELEERWISNEIAHLLRCGVVVQLNDRPLTGTYPVFTVPKAPGHSDPRRHFRLIFDLRGLNEHLLPVTFSLDSVREILKWIKVGEWAVQADLSSGFFHLKVCEEHSKYLAFEWKGKFYCYKGLPFGCSSSPGLFAELLQTLVAWWRPLGIKCWVYIDDISIFSANFWMSTLDYSTMLHSGSLGGLAYAILKLIQPTQRLPLLGHVIKLDIGAVALKDGRRELRIKQLDVIIKQALKFGQRPFLSQKRLQTCIGRIMSCRVVYPEVRSYCTSLYLLLTMERRKYFLNRQAVSDLQSLRVLFAKYREIPLFSPWLHTVILITDASTYGWGGYVEGLQETAAFGAWSRREQQLHINVQATLAVVKVMNSLVKQQPQLLQGKRLKFITDSMVMVYAGRKGGSSSFFLNWAIGLQQRLVRSLGSLVVRFEHLPGVLNNIADSYSRGGYHLIVAGSWRTKRSEFFQFVLNNLGINLSNSQWVDRFAAADNKLTRRYNTLDSADLAAEGVDALRQDWSGQRNLVIAPFVMLSPIVRLLLTTLGPVLRSFLPYWKFRLFVLWMLTAFRLLGRGSEVLALRNKHFNPSSGPSHAAISLARPKTHTPHKWMPVGKVSGIARLMKECQSFSHGRPQDFIFQDEKGHWTTNFINKILREVSKRLGIKPKLTSHSFRIGGAVHLIQLGIPLAVVMKIGQWRSNAIDHYLEALAVDIQYDISNQME